MCFSFTRAIGCKRCGFNIGLVAVVLEPIKSFQWAREQLVNTSVTWRVQKIVNSFKLEHNHSILDAIILYIFGRLKAYAFRETCQLQNGGHACKQLMENEQKSARCCLSNSNFALRPLALQKCIQVGEKVAVPRSILYSIQLYVDKLLHGLLWRFSCKQLEVYI